MRIEQNQQTLIIHSTIAQKFNQIKYTVERPQQLLF